MDYFSFSDKGHISAKKGNDMLTMNWQRLQDTYGANKKKKKKNKVTIESLIAKNKSLEGRVKELEERLSKYEVVEPSKKEKRKIEKEKKRREKEQLDRKEKYARYLEMSQWIKKREKIKARDEHRCQLCGSVNNLQVHHTKYNTEELTPPWAYPDKTLITVCKCCHEKIHSDPNHPLNPYKKRSVRD